jgi:hypothetical protein
MEKNVFLFFFHQGAELFLSGFFLPILAGFSYKESATVSVSDSGAVDKDLLGAFCFV